MGGPIDHFPSVRRAAGVQSETVAIIPRVCVSAALKESDGT